MCTTLEVAAAMNVTAADAHQRFWGVSMSGGIHWYMIVVLTKEVIDSCNSTAALRETRQPRYTSGILMQYLFIVYLMAVLMAQDSSS